MKIKEKYIKALEAAADQFNGLMENCSDDPRTASTLAALEELLRELKPMKGRAVISVTEPQLEAIRGQFSDCAGMIGVGADDDIDTDAVWIKRGRLVQRMFSSNGLEDF